MGEEEERRGIESRVVGGLSRFVARSSKWDVLSYMDHSGVHQHRHYHQAQLQK